MQLKVLSATSFTNTCNTSVAMLASTAMKPNMVAMFGCIMPEPLDMPVKRTCSPSTTNSRLPDLATVSVVMMALAATSQCTGFIFLMAVWIFSYGKGSKITPVENGNTWLASHLICSATAAHTARARFKPSSPVPALALPVFTTKARMLLLGSNSWHTRTGAAQ